ncbi:MAG: hypothetical protein SPJ84_06690 [Fusobacterium gastrosuis]|uniref:hypothetical protein n=1 Tax=Fusobacterium gastrosuis TaxID=1755100 RepID=UPI002A97DC2C|nr:hypothetical protein [Fusobacterium gastrosuis]
MIERIMNNILNEIKGECDYITFLSCNEENGIYISKKASFSAGIVENAIYELAKTFDLKGFEATIYFVYNEIELYKNNKTKRFLLENKDNLFSQLLEIISKESEADENK